MDKELKAKWLEALRSGKYQQGWNQLRDHKDRFCCLGVLCDVYDSSQWKNGLWDGMKTFLPIQFCTMLPKTLVRRCMRMNDGEPPDENGPGRKSFAEIADYIEANL